MRINNVIKNLSKDYRDVLLTSITSIVFLISIPTIIMSSASSKINPFTQAGEGSNNKSFIQVEGTSKVNVYITKEKSIKEIDLEDYIIGVVSSEMQASFDIEALKAQAVAARTYYFSRRIGHCDISPKEADICDTTHCQVFMSKEERLSKWDSKDAENNYNKISEAVKSTEGQVLTYNNELVLHPLFFSTSSGKTEDSKDVFSGDVPYLKSIDSPGEEIAPRFKSSVSFKLSDVVNKINSSYPAAKVTNTNLKNELEIKKRTEAGTVVELKIGNTTIKGTQFRTLLGLNSSNFQISYSGDTINIDCKGYGHDVGMSQWGANVMGASGKKYDEILKHYYSGVEIMKVEYKK